MNDARRARILAAISNFELKQHSPPDRIRRLVETTSDSHRCELCGYTRKKGMGVHPYAGIHGRTKSQTKWCNGKTVIYPKDYVHPIDLELGD